MKNASVNASPVIVKAVYRYANMVERIHGETRCPEIRREWIESTIAWAQMVYEAKGAERIETALFDQITKGNYFIGQYIPFDDCPHWHAQLEARKIKNAEAKARIEAQ